MIGPYRLLDDMGLFIWTISRSLPEDLQIGVDLI